MALPKIDVPFYEINLPSNNTKILYRGFLVSEEKILLMALQSEDASQMILALQQIITNCTNGAVDPKTMPIFDVEYLFINIRAKSVGEQLELAVVCDNCGDEINYTINLNDIMVQKPEKSANKIKLTDTVGLVMQYPTITTIDAIEGLTDQSSINDVVDAISSCVEYIYDEDGVYYIKDQEKQEIYGFFESLNASQMEMIKMFFDSIPSISENIEFDCPKCNTHNKYEIKGISNFFL